MVHPERTADKMTDDKGTDTPQAIERAGHKDWERLVLGENGIAGIVRVVVYAVAFAAVVGHVFPVWFEFRGGKGAATAAGLIFFLAPDAGLVVIGWRAVPSGPITKMSLFVDTAGSGSGL